jgi:hypothetical protein
MKMDVVTKNVFVTVGSELFRNPAMNITTTPTDLTVSKYTHQPKFFIHVKRYIHAYTSLAVT